MDSPTMGREDLQTKVLPELQQIAGTLGVTGHQRLKKSELIDAIMAKAPGDGHVASEDGAGSGNGAEGRDGSGASEARATGKNFNATCCPSFTSSAR